MSFFPYLFSGTVAAGLSNSGKRRSMAFPVLAALAAFFRTAVCLGGIGDYFSGQSSST